jgi:hypothetical protein
MIKWIYKPNGNCPVQSEGYFLGKYFYFRARWNYVKIEFANSEDDWHKNIYKSFLVHKTGEYEAGHLKKWFCRLLIYKGCLMYLFDNIKNKL